MAKTVQTARMMRHLVHVNFCVSSLTQLCPLGTGTEVPLMLGGAGCSLLSFTMGLRFSCFLPGDVCTPAALQVRREPSSGGLRVQPEHSKHYGDPSSQASHTRMTRMHWPRAAPMDMLPHLYSEGGGEKPLLFCGRHRGFLVMLLKLILDEL